MTTPRLEDVLVRVQSWIRQCDESDVALARRAGVDGKTIRMARQSGWSPTTTILRRVEALIPADWQPAPAAETTIARES